MLILHPDDARRPLHFLHLKSRTIESLHQLGIDRLDQFVAWPTKALKRRFPSQHQGGRRSIEGARKALSQSVSRDGKIDWQRYAQHCGFPIIPKRSQKWTPIDVIRVLPDTAMRATRSRYGNNAAQALKHRLIGPAADRPTLRKVGDEVGITKEGLRFNQNRVLDMLRQVIFSEDYTNCPFYIRPNYLLHLQRMGRYLNLKIGEGMTYSRWRTLLRKKWHVGVQDISRVETLVVGLFGFSLLIFPEDILTPIICRHARHKTLLIRAAKEALNILTNTHYRGVQRGELEKEIAKRFRATPLSQHEIRVVLESLVAVKKDGGLYLAKTSALRRIADRCQRVLESSGQPMYYKEIAAVAVRAYSRRKREKKRIRLLLSHDPRFVPTSETGYWALAKWKVEKRTVTQICLDELKKAGRPLDENYLYRATAKRRSVKLRSIRRLLLLSRDVQRAGPKLWALADQPLN